MADSAFIVKNGLVVNGSFTANSTTVNAAAINATSYSIGTTLVANTTEILFGSTATGSNNFIANATTISVGNSSIYTTVNATSFTGTSSNATNLNSQPGSYYTNATNITTGTLPYAQLGANVVNTSANFTITGIHTYQANLVVGNTTVNTQFSNSTILISNSTSTTTIGLGSINVGNTATNVVIANTTSTFGGNVSITGSLTSANVTATVFTGNVTGNVTGTSSNATNLNSQPGSYYTNATNITTGTLPYAQLGANAVNTSANFTITGVYTYQSNLTTGNTTVNTQFSNSTILISNSTTTTTIGLGSINIGNTTTNVVISNTTSTFGGNVSITGSLSSANVTATVFTGNVTGNVTGTSSNATNLNSQPGSYYTNATNITTGTLPYAQLGANVVNTSANFTITGVYTYQANLVIGNTTVNTQFSNSTILISNSTSTTTLGLGSINVGNTTTNVVIANTTSSFGGNVSITGSLSSANVTATVFTGNVTGTSSNATNLNSQPGSYYTNATNITTGTLPYAQLGANVVNTSANFTITGIHTYQANLVIGNTTVNTQFSNSTILISNSTTTTTIGLGSINIGNTTTNVVISNTTSTFGGNVSITGSLSSANLTTTTNVVTIGTSAYYVANGNFGVGNNTPSNKLVVAGAVQSTTGGIVFPDSTTQTTAATAYTQPTTYGAIGTYVHAAYAVTSSGFAVNPTNGSNYAGSTLYRAGNPAGMGVSSMGLSGTWKCMGTSIDANGVFGGCPGGNYAVALWLRIS